MPLLIVVQLQERMPKMVVFVMCLPPPIPAGHRIVSMFREDEETYETTRTIDSDDDRLVPPLSEEDIELTRHFCPNIDPLVPEFSDLRDCDGAYAEGRDDELLEAPDVGDNMEVRKGLVFKDLTTLKLK